MACFINFGLFSIFASQQVGDRGKVFAFDPIKETYDFLSKNVKFNKISNTETLPYALGDTGKKINFYINKNCLVQSSSEIERDYTDVQEVEQITLDNFFEENHLQRLDFIKADIEGAERKFLKGAEKSGGSATIPAPA